MNVDLNRLYKDAAELYRAQSHQPNSPGEYDEDHGYLLCAASCIAYIGAKLNYLEKSPSELIECITQTNDKEIVVDALNFMGISESVCIDVMEKNDACDPSYRKNIIYEYMQQLH